jgi:hypothetical protein
MIDRRRREEPDPFLEWKLRIFFAGALLMVLGVFLDREVLLLLAAAVLGVGMVFILIARYRERRAQDERIAWYNEHDDPPPPARD